jgi:hypothetical protein
MKGIHSTTLFGLLLGCGLSAGTAFRLEAGGRQGHVVGENARECFLLFAPDTMKRIAPFDSSAG